MPERDPGRPELLLEGVSLRRGAHAVLDRVDLSLPVRARTVILGPNGAGKTSLLQVVHGLAEPDAGSARGRDASGMSTAWRFGFVFQKPVMLRRSARGNVEHALAIAGLASRERRARANRALAEVGLLYAADRPARQLSGGEQQRLAIARAQAAQPDCLLLDEPTSSLDPSAAAGIERYLAALSSRGTGIVMATHDLGQARRLAQHVVFMHRGRVVEAGEAMSFFAGPRSDAARRFLAGEHPE
ncbi:MAG TPA: ATP-binding cassette domain-containing protein [Quisquiliibacterium sp.]|nr:ATP-binding cassette domain-containing protein [Quisquiliibacterium sp.]